MRNKLLSSQQSGNKKQHSTETLNLLITDLLLDAIDNKKISALVLIDLSKAFDSISVEKLFIYKTRFGAKQISTKVITQNSFRKFSIVPACAYYHMTF